MKKYIALSDVGDNGSVWVMTDRYGVPVRVDDDGDWLYGDDEEPPSD